MIVFGLILVLLALAAGVALFLATQSLTTPVDLELAGYNWGMTPLALLVTGAVAMLLFWFGLGIIRGSAKRKRRPVREAKDADRQAKLEESIRADERTRAEDTHQSALAERDRVRDEEFQTRLADRDRERDSEFATREQQAEQQARESEERVRADERRKVEQEYATRTPAVGAGTAGAAGAAAGGSAAGSDAGTAGSGAAGAAGADTSSGRHSSDAEMDSVTSERQTETDGHADAPAAGADGYGDARDHSNPATTDATQTLDRDASAEPTGTDSADLTDSADSADGQAADEDASHPGVRTVADKIMGRDPADRG